MEVREGGCHYLPLRTVEERVMPSPFRYMKEVVILPPVNRGGGKCALPSFVYCHLLSIEMREGTCLFACLLACLLAFYACLVFCLLACLLPCFLCLSPVSSEMSPVSSEVSPVSSEASPVSYEVSPVSSEVSPGEF